MDGQLSSAVALGVSAQLTRQVSSTHAHYLSAVNSAAAFLGASKAALTAELAKGASLASAASDRGVSRSQLIADIASNLRASASPDERDVNWDDVATRLADRVMQPTPATPGSPAMPGSHRPQDNPHPEPTIAEHDGWLAPVAHAAGPRADAYL